MRIHSDSTAAAARRSLIGSSASDSRSAGMPLGPNASARASQATTSAWCWAALAVSSAAWAMARRAARAASNSSPTLPIASCSVFSWPSMVARSSPSASPVSAAASLRSRSSCLTAASAASRSAVRLFRAFSSTVRLRSYSGNRAAASGSAWVGSYFASWPARNSSAAPHSGHAHGMPATLPPAAARSASTLGRKASISACARSTDSRALGSRAALADSSSIWRSRCARCRAPASISPSWRCRSLASAVASLISASHSATVAARSSTAGPPVGTGAVQSAALMLP
ncbi:hypothetical protein D9M72_472190 [compost metagenome]